MRPKRDPGGGGALVSIRAGIVGEELRCRCRRTLLPFTPISDQASSVTCQLGVSEHYAVLYEKVYGVQTESVKYARLLDRLAAEDSRSWAMNQYDLGSMGYVSIEQSSNGVKIVKGYYSYSHGKRGWVEAKFVNYRLSCCIIGTEPTAARLAKVPASKWKGPPQRLLAIHGQLHRLHQSPHRRG